MPSPPSSPLLQVAEQDAVVVKLLEEVRVLKGYLGDFKRSSQSDSRVLFPPSNLSCVPPSYPYQSSLVPRDSLIPRGESFMIPRGESFMRPRESLGEEALLSPKIPDSNQ